MSRTVVPVNGFGVQHLKTLCLSADLYAQNLKTLWLSTHLVLRGWKRCACQRIWRSMSRNVVPVNGFGVQKLGTLCLSADLVFKI